MSKETVTIGSAQVNQYILMGVSIAERHLAVTPLSASEYIIHNISGLPRGLVVARQAVMIARVDTYTPIQLGEVHTTLKEIFQSKHTAIEHTQAQHKLKTHYKLSPKRAYLVGASDVCDIQLISPKVSWHALKLTWDQDKWHIECFTRRRKFHLSAPNLFTVGHYTLRLETEGRVEVHKTIKDRLTLKSIDVINPRSRSKKISYLLRGLSISMKAGEFAGVIGPSGAGKSTMLKAIKGIIPIHAGQILLAGADIGKEPSLLKELGFVPQDDVVIPELTVEENLQFSARLRLPADWPSEAKTKKVNEILTALNLEQVRSIACSQISGGQRKRVNLALEMLLEPAFLLADEVCSGLSSLDTDNILRHLRQIADEGKGVILTIHSPDIEAFDLMDTLLVLDQGGFIAYYGPAQPDAIRYFSKQDYSPYKSPKLIFDVLEKKQHDKRKTEPEDWYQIYRNSSYYREYIENRLNMEKG